MKRHIRPHESAEIEPHLSLRTGFVYDDHRRQNIDRGTVLDEAWVRSIRSHYFVADIDVRGSDLRLIANINNRFILHRHGVEIGASVKRTLRDQLWDVHGATIMRRDYEQVGRDDKGVPLVVPEIARAVFNLINGVIEVEPTVLRAYDPYQSLQP